ncbi:hypothetical protein ACNQF7_01330 [Flavobacterium sp. RSP29]|uniref:hypothetical protein n=1 Tax=Flavobacterium sp. RSP29 TaxID=3401731 RepID=UPI003AB0FD41
MKKQEKKHFLTKTESSENLNLIFDALSKSQMKNIIGGQDLSLDDGDGGYTKNGIYYKAVYSESTYVRS